AAAKDRARGRAVQEILQRRIQFVAPGLSATERECIASVWSGGKPESWRTYFEAVRALEPGFLRGSRKPRGFDRMVAEQHYALYFRERRHRRVLLKELAAVDSRIFFQMPWLRMLAAAFR
ncbi:MAG: hypothetical protein ACREKL_17290, partial [Chthoniobacterales bacterium]